MTVSRSGLIWTSKRTDLLPCEETDGVCIHPICTQTDQREQDGKHVSYRPVCLHENRRRFVLGYRTIAKAVKTSFVEKKSEFIATLVPVQTAKKRLLVSKWYGGKIERHGTMSMRIFCGKIT